jgi:hypothetical protein
MMDYYNGVRGFINYAISNPKNINEGGISVHARCVRIKSFSI